VNLIETIGSLQELKPYNDSPCWFSYSNKTPRYCIVSFCRIADHDNFVVLVNIRNSFAPQALNRFLKLIDDKIQGLVPAKTIDKLTNPVTSDHRFDCWIALGPSAHNNFRIQNASVHARTVVCCPIFNCEFAGDESAEEIEVMRSDFVDTLDWNREPSPKLRMRFDNPKTGGGSEGTEFGFARPRVLFHELTLLDGIIRGWIELLNFKGEFLRVQSVQPRQFVFLDTNGNRVRQLDTDSAAQFLSNFLAGTDYKKS
jgi:hypothetical protein